LKKELEGFSNKFFKINLLNLNWIVVIEF
jgi:hypothetical protein